MLHYLNRMRVLRALRFLEPVALAGVLSPDLAAVAVLLPELLAGLLLLSHTFLLVDSFVFAFLTENFFYNLIMLWLQNLFLCSANKQMVFLQVV